MEMVLKSTTMSYMLCSKRIKFLRILRLSKIKFVIKDYGKTELRHLKSFH